MWLVVYGHGRAVRIASSGGGVSRVWRFTDKASADASVAMCRSEGLDATEPRKLGRE